MADTQSPAGDESCAHDGDLDLLAKHVLSVPTLDMEIQQYRCLNISPDDARNTQRIPTAVHVSRAILLATGAPSERIFSTAELTVISRRSQLSQPNVNEIIFITRSHGSARVL